MSQTIVPFASGIDPLTSTLEQVQQNNVFDFEISAGAQTYYTNLMKDLQSNYNFLLSMGGTVSAGDSHVTAIKQELAALNAWAQMKSVNAVNGQQVNTYNTVITTTPPTPPPADATNPDGSPVSVTSTNNAFNPTLAVSGLTLSNPPLSIGLTTSMNQYMAQGLVKINNLLTAAGYNPDGFSAGNANSSLATALTSIITSATAPNTVDIYQFGAALQSAINAAGQARVIGFAQLTGSQSIQQALMVDYISRGNDVLFTQMSQLKTALDSNNTILGYLNALQDLMNQKTPQQFVQQLQSLSTSTGALTDANYSTFESATFSNTLGTVADFSDSPIQPIIAPLTAPAIDPSTGQLELTTYQSGDIIPDAINPTTGANYAVGDTIPYFDPTLGTPNISERSGHPIYQLAVANFSASTNPPPNIYTSANLPSSSIINPITGRQYVVGDIIPVYVPGSNPPVRTTYTLGGAHPNLYLFPSEFITGTSSIYGQTGAPPLPTNVINPLTGQNYKNGDLVPFFDPTLGPPTISKDTSGHAIYANAGDVAAIDPATGSAEKITYQSGDTIPAVINPLTGVNYAVGDTIPFFVPGSNPPVVSTRTNADGSVVPIYQESEVSLAAYAKSLATNGTSPLLNQAFATTDGSYTYSKATIINSLQTLLGKTQNDRLKLSLNSLITDLNTTSTGTVADWVKDLQGQSYGSFQQNLSSAVTASQSFNDTQQAQLQSIMFVFEEFYKSASSLLSDLNTLLLKIADNMR